MLSLSPESWSKFKVCLSSGNTYYGGTNNNADKKNVDKASSWQVLCNANAHIAGEHAAGVVRAAGARGNVCDANQNVNTIRGEIVSSCQCKASV